MRRLRTGLLVALAAVALAGCTYVPTDGQPHVENRHGVPFHLLRPAPAPPVSPR